MANLKCLCGSRMSNTDVPSKNIIYVFTKQEVENAILNDSKISLIDFESIDREYEYWYCLNCSRVYQVENIPCGKVISSFIKTNKTEIVDQRNKLWSEYYIFTELEMYNAEEMDETLEQFISLNGDNHKYEVDSTNKSIYKENELGQFELIYQEEKNH